MRGAWVGGLLVALLLAGCAQEPSAGTVQPHVIRTYLTPDPTPPILEWRVLAARSMTILPQTSSMDVAVPAGALTVIVNQTLDAGAAYGIKIAFGECLWDKPQTFVAIGQTIGADCGGLTEGTWALQMSTTAGALSARIEPVALLCQQTSPGWRCPPPHAPVRS